ncbi:MAG: hypothetical protein ACYSVY_16435, partial [Planctomycetota bacterium]
MYDLNDLIDEPGWVLVAAVDINERGEIVGRGTLDGVEAGFFLQPIVQDSGDSVPDADGQPQAGADSDDDDEASESPDLDGDGLADSLDDCPTDPNKIAPGV